MTLHTLLIGPSGHGGEGVYVAALKAHAPAGVTYDTSDDFHNSAIGATCILPVEVALNRFVRQRTFPDIGIRALRLRQPYDLIHAHAHPVWLRHIGTTPLIMSEGSSAAVYLADYLGWNTERIARAFSRSERIFRSIGVHDRLLTLGGVAKLYVFSEWAREINIGWGVDPDKIEVIYPGFATPQIVMRGDRETFTFLFIGTDFERKGGYEVVDAFYRIAADMPHVRLLIVGSDESCPNPDRLVHSWVSPARQAYVRGLLNALLARGQARHLSWLSGEQLHAEMFPVADAFVMPTYAEGFGFTNVEAMSHGIPVITSTAGPATEIVEDGRTGILISPGDVEALAEAMYALATQPETAAAMGTASRERFDQRFTRERFRQNLGDLYRRVLAAA